MVLAIVNTDHRKKIADTVRCFCMQRTDIVCDGKYEGDMNDKKKIEVLRAELDKYKGLSESVKEENKKLSETVEKLTLQEEERQKDYDEHNLQYEKMKTAFNNAVSELNEYKTKYALLTGQLRGLKKRYRKEFEKILGKMKNNAVTR